MDGTSDTSATPSAPAEPVAAVDPTSTSDSPMKKRRKTGRGKAIAADDDDEGQANGAEETPEEGAPAAEADTDMKAVDVVDLDSDGEAQLLTSGERQAKAASSNSRRKSPDDDQKMDESGEDEEADGDAPARKRLQKGSDAAAAPASSEKKLLRPKKDLSAADKKKIAAATAEKKNQPSVASFFGGGGAKPKGAITSFFKPKGAATTEAAAATPAAAPASPAKAAAPAPAAFVDESGKITVESSKETAADADMPDAAKSTPTKPPPPASPASSSKKPTAGKRKRDAANSPTVTPVAAPKSPAASPLSSPPAPAAKAEPASNAAKSKEAQVKAAIDAMDVDDAEDDAAKAPTSTTPAPAAAAKAPAKEKKPAAAAASAKKEKPATKKETKAKASAAAASSSSSSSKKAGGKSAAVVAEEEVDSLVDEIERDLIEKEREGADDDQHESDEDDDLEALAASIDTEDDASFDPVKSATWKVGQDVPFAALAKVFERLENERARTVTIGWLSNFLRSVIALSPHQLVTVVYLACNQIAPAYEGERTNVGDAILCKAIGKAVGNSAAQISQAAKKEGDLGAVALQSRGAQSTLSSMLGARPKALTCQRVFDEYRLLADSEAKGMSGKGSQDVRANKIHSLLVACQGQEAKFIVRGLQGNLRIHMAEKSVIAALARAVTLTPPSLTGELPPKVLDARKQSKANIDAELAENTKLIQQAYIELPSHRKVIEAILQFGVKELPTKCFLEPGIPVKVMLGKPCNGVDAILEKFGELLFTLEYKYDGARAQIHMLDDGSMKIYSRNSQDDTPKYPDLIRDLPNAFATEIEEPEEEAVEEVEGKAQTAPAASSEESKMDTTDSTADAVVPAAASSSSPTSRVKKPFLMRNFILDCEVVAWDRTLKKILPFQALTTRKKKDVDEKDITVQVCLFGFDLLYMNGVSYMNEQFIRRRAILHQHFHEVEGTFMFATSKDTADLNEMRSFMSQAIRDSCEGLMVKGLEVDAQYVPNKRNWFKLKKDYIEGCADTMDLVVIGGWHGKGKRTGGYGAFLLATYDRDSEEYQSCCAIGTGLSDADLDRFSQLHREAEGDQPEQPAYFTVIASPPRHYKYPTNNAPDVWFEPTRVWEIKCADLSVSPAHFAAINLQGQGKPEGKGIALRFPRLERERTDKSVPDDLSDAEFVLGLFEAQSVQGGGGGKGGRMGGGR